MYEVSDMASRVVGKVHVKDLKPYHNPNTVAPNQQPVSVTVSRRVAATVLSTTIIYRHGTSRLAPPPAIPGAF